jgi:predicted MFS family arabinose efflux permease
MNDSKLLDEITPSAEVLKAKFTTYQKVVIAILALTQFTVVLDFMVMSPLGDLLKKTMDLTPSQFSYVVASYAISAFASGFLTAGFADKFDRKKLLMFFYIGFIVGTYLCGMVETYPMLIFARIVTGVFGGVMSSISMAIVADLFSIQQRGRVMGFMQMGFGSSQVLGIPISLWIANIWGWQSPFFLIVAMSMVILVVIVLYLKPVVKHLEEQKDENALLHLFHTLKQRNYRIGFLATALMSIGGYMIMPWGSVFAVNNLKVTADQLPVLFMISGIATLIIMPIIGKLSDKMDKFNLFVIASIWMIVVIVIYTQLVPVPFWFIVLMNVLMMMGVMSRMVPSMALVSALPEMHDRGSFMSINSSLQQLSGGVATLIGGMIVHQKTKDSPLENYDILGYVIVVILIVCAINLWRVSKIVKEKSS